MVRTAHTHASLIRKSVGDSRSCLVVWDGESHEPAEGGLSGPRDQSREVRALGTWKSDAQDRACSGDALHAPVGGLGRKMEHQQQSPVGPWPRFRGWRPRVAVAIAPLPVYLGMMNRGCELLPRIGQSAPLLSGDPCVLWNPQGSRPTPTPTGGGVVKGRRDLGRGHERMRERRTLVWGPVGSED